jgi:hypothetical protein
MSGVHGIRRPRHLARLSPVQLGVFFAVASIVPLALLAYFSVSLASEAVEREAAPSR